MNEIINLNGGQAFSGVIHIGAHGAEEAEDYGRNGVQKVSQLGVIAHEMFHRVTSRLGRMARLLWVSEMMAVMSELGFMHVRGYDEYVTDFIRSCMFNEPPLDPVRIVRSASE